MNIIEGQTGRYKIEIWRYHNMVDSYESDDIELVKKWFREKWYWTYDNGDCAFDVYEDGQAIGFDREYDLGFYDLEEDNTNE